MKPLSSWGLKLVLKVTWIITLSQEPWVVSCPGPWASAHPSYGLRVLEMAYTTYHAHFLLFELIAHWPTWRCGWVVHVFWDGGSWERCWENNNIRKMTSDIESQMERGHFHLLHIPRRRIHASLFSRENFKGTSSLENIMWDPRATYYMTPFIWSIPNRSVHRHRKQVGDSQVLGIGIVR